MSSSPLALEIEVLPDVEAAARRAARLLAEEAGKAIAARGHFSLALSGGSTPWKMLWAFSKERVAWASVHLFQVDERVAPAGHPDRNLTHLQESLLAHVPIPASNVHAMPVEDASPTAAARTYASLLETRIGAPPVLDVVHLGLGGDGHTASLVPGDAALEVVDEDVTVAGPYQGHLRLTLTYPAIDRARRILWLVAGADKGPALGRLLDGDTSIPAGRVRRDRAVVVADAAAVGSAHSSEGPAKRRDPT